MKRVLIFLLALMLIHGLALAEVLTAETSLYFNYLDGKASVFFGFSSTPQTIPLTSNIDYPRSTLYFDNGKFILNDLYAYLQVFTTDRVKMDITVSPFKATSSDGSSVQIDWHGYYHVYNAAVPGSFDEIGKETTVNFVDETELSENAVRYPRIYNYRLYLEVPDSYVKLADSAAKDITQFSTTFILEVSTL